MIIYGYAFLRGGIDRVYIEIEDGLIKDISKDKPKGRVERFDEHGWIILPGMIDLHVHIRDFQQSYKEDFYSGTSAAAAGGVCLVMDMPNTIPRNNTLKVLYERDRVAAKSSVVDYGLYYGLPGSREELVNYDNIAWGLKIYPDDYDKPMLMEALKYNRERGILTIIHPEDPSDIEYGHRDLGCELRGIAKFIELSLKHGYKLHLTHLTSLNSILLSRIGGSNITVDTCPHYLLLNNEEHMPPYYRVNPPLRTKYVQEQLLKNISHIGDIIITTDHAPHTYEEKTVEVSAPGFPGLETCLPILLTLFRRGYLSLEDIVKLYSMKPAKILGLYRYLGSIEVGKMANLIVCDINEEYRFDPTKFHSKAKHTPYEDMKVCGRIHATMIRGEFVYRNGEVTVERGYGENIKRLINVEL